MSLETSQTTNERVVFKSEVRIFFTIIGLLASIYFLMHLSLDYAHQGRILVSITVLILSIVALVFAVLVSLGQQSDIVISDQGISRVMFGKTWQSIPWKSVREIHQGLTPRFSKPPVKCCWIYPSLEPRPNCRFIAICYGRKDISRLLEVINRYVSEHNIKIVSKTPGNMTNIRYLTT